jgi:hypothetical protein
MNNSIDELPGRGEKVWFIIRADSHEGPYSFSSLEERLAAGEFKRDSFVWARGWPEALPYIRVESAYRGEAEAKPTVPPARIVRATPEQSHEGITEDESPPALPRRASHWPLFLGVLGMLGVGLWATSALKPQAELARPADMNIDAFRKMRTAFEQINRPVPIPEVVVAADYRKIWLADGTTQMCHYQATFRSEAGDNLGGQVVSFQTDAPLIQHWAMFDRLSFSEGQKLMPGRYLLTVVRQDCAPQGLMSFWETAHPPLNLSFTVEIFHGSPEELQARMGMVAKKKEAEEKQRRELSLQAWRDVGEKLRTLSAISQQIESGFNGLLNRRLAWKPRMQGVIDGYTMRFGGFLTNFTVKNDEDFSALAAQDFPDKVELMGRQPLINAHAKRIGFLSMGLIEKLQKNADAPNRSDLEDWLRTLQQDFAVERESIRRAIAEATQMADPSTQTPAQP